MYVFAVIQIRALIRLVAVATIRERHLSRSALAQVRLQFESGVYSRAASIRSYMVYTISYLSPSPSLPQSPPPVQRNGKEKSNIQHCKNDLEQREKGGRGRERGREGESEGGREGERKEKRRGCEGVREGREDTTIGCGN